MNFIKNITLSLVGSLVLVGCHGAPMPSYHTGEDSIYSSAINQVVIGDTKSQVTSLLGTPTKTYSEWTKEDIVRNMKKEFNNPNSFDFDNPGTYDLWYYYAKRHESYMGLMSNTFITIPKYCYLAFSNIEDKLVWKQCFQAETPK